MFVTIVWVSVNIERQIKVTQSIKTYQVSTSYYVWNSWWCWKQLECSCSSLVQSRRLGLWLGFDPSWTICFQSSIFSSLCLNFYPHTLYVTSWSVFVNATKLWPDHLDTDLIVNTVELVQMGHSGYAGWSSGTEIKYDFTTRSIGQRWS